MDLWRKNGYSISTDKQYLDVNTIHQFLSNDSYWSKGIPLELVAKAIENTAFCFGVYKGEIGYEEITQVGFARVTTDKSTFAYLSDVFILPEYRGKGLSKWLVEVIVNHPDLQQLRRFMLATKDAHTLYSKYGFQPVDNPERFMEKVQIPFYQQS